MSVKISFIRENKNIEVPEGTTVLEAEQMAGIRADAPCGGRGKCGKCAVVLLEGSSRVTVRACQARAGQDLLVQTLPQAEVSVLTAGIDRDIPPDSGIGTVCCMVKPIEAGEALSVWERTRESLARRLHTEAEDMKVSPSVLGKLYPVLTECGGEAWFVLDGSTVIDVCREKPVPLVFAVDIGTTTIAGYLMEAETGYTAAVTSMLNPQIAYGSDVISRAQYTLDHGTEKLTSCVRNAVSELSGRACRMAGVNPEHVYSLTLAGNTCMHHLFCGISPEALVKAPYSPVIRETEPAEAGSLALTNICPGARVKFLPNIAGFVGADTAGCLLSCDFDSITETTLILDIGTNGEMVLTDGKSAYACSTAAGPAFEGARIDCGMRGAVGAIDHVWEENGQICFSTIGDGQPEGICGSGLLDACAVLLNLHRIDAYGNFEDEACGGKYIFYQNKENGRQVYVSSKDLSELALAKAAIAAGIRILCRKFGIAPEEIKKVKIAGAFGNYMKPESAVRIGLLPGVSSKAVEGVGNAAGEGAKMAAISRGQFEKVREEVRRIKFAELAAEPDFEEIFAQELAFPEG